MVRKLFPLFVFTSLTFACTTAPDVEPVVVTEPAAEAERDGRFALDQEIPLDPDVVHGELENGLNYYVLENARPANRAALRLVVNAGSLQEDEDQRGLAHFVEHMAFNGTENFEKQEIVDYLESIGMKFGPDVNAYTSFDETVYMLEIPLDDPAIVDRGFEILREWAGRIAFEGEEIDKERGVVIEEWRLRRGAGGRIRDKELPVIYHGSRYAERDVIGEKEILENAPHDAFRRFYDEWYRPELMAVVAVGDFEAGRIAETIRRHFGDLEPAPDAPERIEYPVPGHEETLVSIVTDPESTGTSVTLGFKRPAANHETVGDLRRNLVDRFAEHLLSQRLDELRRKPDPPFQFAYTYTSDLGRTKSMFRMYARVPGGEVQRGVTTLLTEATRAKEYGFLESELDRARVSMLRSIDSAWEERDKEESSRFASMLSAHFLDDNPNPGIGYWRDLYHEIVPTITLEEVNERAKEWISEDNRIILVSAPEDVREALPEQQDLVAAVDAADQLGVTPWVDETRDEPLIAEDPQPGEIVSSETIDELDVTLWTLSNGAEVILKPTDFKNDEVWLKGFSPGGHSLVSDEDYMSAMFASRLVGEMGAGSFSSIELQKALTGKIAYAWMSISEMYENVGGRASPHDLETMFRLLYLKFVSPRLDRDAAASLLEREKASIEHREGSPEFLFSKKFSEIITNDHPRRGFTTVEDLDRIDPARAVEIYRERYGDASDFTFVIVGAFDLDTIRPMVETWLGGLPGLNRDEHWRPIIIEEPEEIVRFEVEKGIEPKGRVTLRFAEDAEWSPESSFMIRAMADALRIRLREVLREDMGGVYGAFVSGRLNRWPKERANVTIGFGCEPERIDELVSAVFEEIEVFRAEGPEEETVEKVKQAELRARETNLRENRFWVERLEWYARHDLDPRNLLRHDEQVGSITKEAIRDAAREWIDPSSYVLGVLKPESVFDAGSTAESTGGNIR